MVVAVAKVHMTKATRNVAAAVRVAAEIIIVEVKQYQTGHLLPPVPEVVEKKTLVLCSKWQRNITALAKASLRAFSAAWRRRSH